MTSLPSENPREAPDPSSDGEARWRSLLEKTRDWIWEMDLSGRHSYSNPQVELILGYSAEELKELPVADLLHPDDAREVAERLPTLIAERRGWHRWAVRFRHRDGSYRRLESSAEPILDAQGNVRGFRGVDRDVTERRRIELAFGMLLEAASSTVGERFFELAAMRLAEVLEADVALIGELVDGAAGGGRIEPLAACRDGKIGTEGLSFHLEDTASAGVVGQRSRIYASGVRELFPRDALLAELEIEGYIGVPLFGASGAPLGIIVVLGRGPIASPDSALAIVELVAERTVTEIGRQRAEAALRESEQRYRELFEHNLAGVLRSTPDGRLLECNDAMARIVGAESAEELLTHPALDLWNDPLDRATYLSTLQETGEVHDFEATLRRVDGTPVQLLGNASLRYGADGAGVIQATVIDVSERRRLEEQLRHAQKMEAIGRLAGGVAHDFNNLLTAVTGFADLGLARADPEDRVAGYLQQIKKASAFGTTLTRQLLAFSRQQVLKPAVLDLNQVIDGFAGLLERSLGESVELETVLAEQLGAVKADAGQIEQVLMNLAVNGRDAMPDGGRLVIETRNVTLDDAYSRTHSGMKPGDWVMLAVSDQGEGMDAETTKRVFDPFFTTKKSAEGTGLGLATVYGIVKQSHGFIWVYSEPGRGTTFKIYLPREGSVADERPAERAPATTAEAAPATILLVEDSEPVRNLLERSLTAEGHTVLVAPSAEEALELVAAHPGAIDLLLTDLVLPQANGLELAGELERQRDGLAVVLMSGYSGNALPAGYEPDADVPILCKPFSTSELLQTVRQALSRDR